MLFSKRICDHTILKNTLSRKTTVVDAGFNTGAFSGEIVRLFSASVIALEPEPHLFSNANVSDKIDLRNVALSTSIGTVKLYEYHNQCASLHEIPATAIYKAHEVQSTTLERLVEGCRSCDFGLLKMDIEGEEMEVLESTPANVLTQFPQITVEFHFRNFPDHKKRFKKVKLRLRKLGFLAINFSKHDATDVLFFKESVFRFPLLMLFLLSAEKYLSGLTRIGARTTRKIRNIAS